MANSPKNQLIHHLRRAVLRADGAGLTDGQLLERYRTQRDDAAFAALVRRHGPMVWGVCRRVLGHHHDAEDAFQAAFLVFVRKAASIEPKEMVVNWLYGVAHQTALKARQTAAKRRHREKQVSEMPDPVSEKHDLWRDLQPVLDEELSRLPAKYRAVILLCDLEGKTRKEAARQIGCPEGTVAGRLARARAILAKRLVRRGVVLSGGALGGILLQNVSTVSVPAAAVKSTIQAANLFAAGQTTAAAAISVKVAALTKGMLKTMFLTKLKITSVVLVIAAIGGVGAGGLFPRTNGGPSAIACAVPAPVLVSEETPPKKRWCPISLARRASECCLSPSLARRANEIRTPPKKRAKEQAEGFLQRLIQVERDAVPFPDDRKQKLDRNLGFYPPAKALVDKAKDARAVREALKKAVKAVAISEIEASLKKLKASTDDKTDRAELAIIERAVERMKEVVKERTNRVEKVYPLNDLTITIEEKKAKK